MQAIYSRVFYPAALAAAAGTLALLSGSQNAPLWDVEYTCSGQEQSQSFFEEDAPQTGTKTYANTVDFHLRSGQALLKSSVNPIHTQTDGAIGFGTRGDNFWTSGLFDRKTGLLTTIEGRQLRISDRIQTIRTTGQYSCKARKSALMV